MVRDSYSVLRNYITYPYYVAHAEHIQSLSKAYPDFIEPTLMATTRHTIDATPATSGPSRQSPPRGLPYTGANRALPEIEEYSKVLVAHVRDHHGEGMANTLDGDMQRYIDELQRIRTRGDDEKMMKYHQEFLQARLDEMSAGDYSGWSVNRLSGPDVKRSGWTRDDDGMETI